MWISAAVSAAGRPSLDVLLFPPATVLEGLQAVLHGYLCMWLRREKRPEAARLVVLGHVFEQQLWLWQVLARRSGDVRARLNGSGGSSLCK
jgi:hypothetical protein